MTSLKNIKNKIFSIAELKKEVQKWKKNNDKIYKKGWSQIYNENIKNTAYRFKMIFCVFF